MKLVPLILIILTTLFIQGCATTKEPMDSTRYDRAVEKQFNEDYQERLKQ